MNLENMLSKNSQLQKIALYHSIYMKYLVHKNRNITGCLEMGKEERALGKWLLIGTRFLLGVNSLKLDCGDSCTLIILKNHWIAISYLNWILHGSELYLNKIG